MKKIDWTPDWSSSSCELCHKQFSIFFVRRHHCRQCGRLLCGVCSNYRRELPECGYDGEVRVCKDCISSPPHITMTSSPSVHGGEITIIGEGLGTHAENVILEWKQEVGWLALTGVKMLLPQKVMVAVIAAGDDRLHTLRLIVGGKTSSIDFRFSIHPKISNVQYSRLHQGGQIHLYNKYHSHIECPLTLSMSKETLFANVYVIYTLMK